MTFMQSLTGYENWLRAELGDELYQPDLDKKHRKMKDGPFPFLRATYWRWAETILDVCRELRGAPIVLAIGDTHLENFGTWRDVEGRLVWGANDFDDAAPMPYALDLVRLAVSAELARNEDSMALDDICKTLLRGYRSGLHKPEPIVLDQEHKDLRVALVLGEGERDKFWEKLELEPELPDTHAPYRMALRDSFPVPVPTFEIARRSAGTGSLGRPRFVGIIGWKGGKVVREAKRLVQSAWSLAHSPTDRTIYTGMLAESRNRSPDPHSRLYNSIVVRRLSPNSRKIEVEDDRKTILSERMLDAMGQELGNCHADNSAAIHAIVDDLDKRGPDWIFNAVKKITPRVEDDYEEFKDNF